MDTKNMEQLIFEELKENMIVWFAEKNIEAVIKNITEKDLCLEYERPYCKKEIMIIDKSSVGFYFNFYKINTEKIYKLYFGESFDSAECLYDSLKSNDEVFKKMTQTILDKTGNKPFYYREWKSDENLRTVDFGSHTQFFFIEEIEVS